MWRRHVNAFDVGHLRRFANYVSFEDELGAFNPDPNPALLNSSLAAAAKSRPVHLQWINPALCKCECRMNDRHGPQFMQRREAYLRRSRDLGSSFARFEQHFSAAIVRWFSAGVIVPESLRDRFLGENDPQARNALRQPREFSQGRMSTRFQIDRVPDKRDAIKVSSHIAQSVETSAIEFAFQTVVAN